MTVASRSPKNYFSFSEQTENAFWTAFLVTITPDASVSPIGTTTADKILKNNGVNGFLMKDTTEVYSGNVTLSVYAKSGDVSTGGIRLYDLTAGAEVHMASFDLSAQTITTTAGSGNKGMESVGSGWFRIFINGTVTAGRSITRRIYPEVIGAGTGKYIYIWGVQYNIGYYPDDYVPTAEVPRT